MTGFNLGGGGFSVGGNFATTVSNDGTNAVFTAPAAGVGLTFSSIGGFASGTFKVLAGTTVAEVEPNDDVNGGNATVTNGERKGSGSLSSPTDRDHFYIDCLDPQATYRIKVTPANFGPVFVNGAGITLDGSGEGTIAPGLDARLIGLTGHTGAYTIELIKQ